MIERAELRFGMCAAVAGVFADAWTARVGAEQTLDLSRSIEFWG